MNRYAAALAAATFAIPAHAQENAGLVQQATQVGVKQCAARVGEVVDYFHGKDAYAHLAVWNKADPDKHLFHGMTTQEYTDGRQISTLAVSPQAERCDVSFTQVFIFTTTCPAARETSFKDWKFYADLQGIPLYEDPSADSVTLALVPAGTSCLAIKTGAFY